MTIDWSGIALVIGAIAAGAGSLVTTILQWKAARKTETNKQEAIESRATNQGILIRNQEVIHTAVNSRLDTALASIKLLETEIRRLNKNGHTSADESPVALAPDGTITTEAGPVTSTNDKPQNG